jgi:hypothetical protein
VIKKKYVIKFGIRLATAAKHFSEDPWRAKGTKSFLAAQKIAKSIQKVGVAASGAGSKSALTVASNQAGFLTKKKGRGKGRRRRSRLQQQMQKRTKSTSM